MTICLLWYQGQCLLKGEVVLIPISVNNIVTSLPMPFDETHLMQIHLRRRLEYNHDYMTDKIHPADIMEVLRFSVNCIYGFQKLIIRKDIFLHLDTE